MTCRRSTSCSAKPRKPPHCLKRLRSGRPAVPTLLELQSAMRASMVERNDGPIAAMLAEHAGPERLNIYRNTFVVGVTKALELTYPAVRRLVGGEFFDGTAGLFIADHPPRAAWLDN